YPTLGYRAPRITEGETAAEWRKRITSTLKDDSPVVFLDNLASTLDSDALASALTTELWTDRELGRTKNVTVSAKRVWCATANTPPLSTELGRRTLFLSLLSVGEARARREPPGGWRHPDLLGWAHEHRADLVWACLVMIQNWVFQAQTHEDGDLHPRGK